MLVSDLMMGEVNAPPVGEEERFDVIGALLSMNNNCEELSTAVGYEMYNQDAEEPVLESSRKRKPNSVYSNDDQDPVFESRTSKKSSNKVTKAPSKSYKTTYKNQINQAVSQETGMVVTEKKKKYQVSPYYFKEVLLQQIEIRPLPTNDLNSSAIAGMTTAMYHELPTIEDLLERALRAQDCITPEMYDRLKVFIKTENNLQEFQQLLEHIEHAKLLKYSHYKHGLHPFYVRFYGESLIDSEHKKGKVQLLPTILWSLVILLLYNTPAYMYLQLTYSEFLMKYSSLFDDIKFCEMKKKKKFNEPTLLQTIEKQQLYRACNIIRFLLQFMTAEKHLEMLLFVLAIVDQNGQKYTRGNKACQSYPTICRIAIIEREGREFK